MKTKRMPTFEEVLLGIKYTPREPIAAFEVVEPLNQIEKHEAFVRASDQNAAGTNPPSSNTGGISEATYYNVGIQTHQDKNRKKLFKKATDGVAFIDTLSFTLHEDVFVPANDLPLPDVIAEQISQFLFDIFGYGLTIQRNGLNGYKISYLMGLEKAQYGQAAFYGNENTVYINLTGLGLTMAADGWEKRLYYFFQERAPKAKITRVDLAHDFINGEYTVEQAKQDWHDGKFNYGKRMPLGECVGADWLNNTKKGKTFYIGSPRSDRRCRFYDKGKEQGDPNSPWVRGELQLRNHKLTLPHDILLNPTPYFIGSYQAIADIFEHYQGEVNKPLVKHKKKDMGIMHVNKYASMQVSPALKMGLELGLTKEQIFDSLYNEQCDMPRRLIKDGLTESHEMMYYHEFERFPRSFEEMCRTFNLDHFKRDNFNYTQPLHNPIGANNHDTYPRHAH